jgi:hypothetical protein
MSFEVNEQLFERAAECVTYFEGKLPATLIEEDIARNDLEALYRHVTEAEAVMSQEELEATDAF